MIIASSFIILILLCLILLKIIHNQAGEIKYLKHEYSVAMRILGEVKEK